MDFSFTEEQRMLVDTLRTMGKREKLDERAAEIDRTGEFPHDLIPLFAEMGLLGMVLSPEYGGQGEQFLTAILAIEELAKFSPMIAAPVFESNLGPVMVVDKFGTEDQKKAFLPSVCSGKYWIAVGMSEPGGGSALTALTTKVVDKGDHYLLNGRKTFISGGGVAEHYLVYVRFGDIRGSDGIGAVLLEKGTPGFTFGKQEEFMGLHGMPSCDLVFEDVKVPKEDVVIPPGGFKDLMMAFGIERCGNSAVCLGVAGGAFQVARDYALVRETFGRPICDRQAVQFMMADMAMKLDAARLLVYRAATQAGQGLPAIQESVMAKCFANEMVREVTDKAMQILGGYGYSKEFPVERMLRDGWGWGVAGGTVQILRITLAGQIFGRNFNQWKI
jgi:alkylation response protein AidB-like acyl-CoA dehydrogenase